MADKIKITGADDLHKIAEPKQQLAILNRALASGATVPKAGIRKAMPASLKKFSKILKHKKVKGSKIALFELGFFGRAMYFVNARGKKWDAFQVLYWHNFGTLNKRNKSHAFDRDRRRVSSDWRGGINPEGFFEKGIEGTESKALEKIATKIDTEMDKVLAKNGFK